MDILLEINTVQIEKNTNKQDEINLITKGILKKNNHFDIISYEESELTGLKGNTTVIKIEDDSVTMIRYGKNKSKMYFKEYCDYSGVYVTDYGNFDIFLHTNKLTINKCEDKKYKIYVEYDIEIKGLFSGVNILNITIK